MSRPDDPTPWFDVRAFERLTTRATETTPTTTPTTTASSPRALERECLDAASALDNERLRACACRDDAFAELASSLPSIRDSDRFVRDLREDVERTLETNASARSERDNARTQKALVENTVLRRAERAHEDARRRVLEVRDTRDALVERAIDACERRSSLSDAEAASLARDLSRAAATTARGVVDRQRLDAFVDAHATLTRKKYACAFVADIARSTDDDA
jgi:hypothetical protein